MVSEQPRRSPKALTDAVRRFVVLVAGLANASDSIEILMVSDVLTAFGPPDNCSICMNDTEKALLAAAMFVGMLFGGVICGSLGDRLLGLSLGQLLRGSWARGTNRHLRGGPIRG